MNLAKKDVRASSESEQRRQSAGMRPAFKPVALPALAAAVRASGAPSSRKPAQDFQAILRKFETQD